MGQPLLWSYSEQGIRVLLSDPANPDHLFLTTDNLHADSTDGGNTWSYRPGGGSDLAVDFSNPSRMFVVNRSSLYQTLNGGSSWSEIRVYHMSRLVSVVGCAIDPLDPATVYLATYNGVFAARLGPQCLAELDSSSAEFGPAGRRRHDCVDSESRLPLDGRQRFSLAHSHLRRGRAPEAAASLIRSARYPGRRSTRRRHPCCREVSRRQPASRPLAPTVSPVPVQRFLRWAGLPISRSWLRTVTICGQRVRSLGLKSGSDTSPRIEYFVYWNPGAPRTGIIRYGNQEFTVHQECGCPLSVSPASRDFTAVGGSGTVNVTAGGECAWTASSSVPWITFPGERKRGRLRERRLHRPPQPGCCPLGHGDDRTQNPVHYPSCRPHPHRGLFHRSGQGAVPAEHRSFYRSTRPSLWSPEEALPLTLLPWLSSTIGSTSRSRVPPTSGSTSRAAPATAASLTRVGLRCPAAPPRARPCALSTTGFTCS